ncbi:MAG: peptidylprolyl isomerase [Pseudomonadota bacterium]
MNKGRYAVRRIALVLLLSTSIGACQSDTTSVVIETSAGPITVALYAEAAPLTVANFLEYVDAGRYDGAAFYRVVRDDNQAQNLIKIDVIQGGLGFDQLGTGFAPISHETTNTTGVTHLDGTLSLARGEPGTGSSEFFITVGAQPSLDFGGMRNPDGLGFAAFGRVTEGMPVVIAIQQMDTVQPTGELEYTSGQMLIEPVRINRVRRLP